ncbi:MAG: transposase, partial [Raineya sp.]|nr:transposase [Raineya sp.]
FPTYTKLTKKIIQQCQTIAEQEQIPIRWNYRRTLKQLAKHQRFRNYPKNKLKAKKADKKMKTIARILVGELERKLPADLSYCSALALYKQVLAQKTDTRDKIYLLHEPSVCCISKGKEQRRYEFGNKASFVRTDSGVIGGAMGFRNEYNGHTLGIVLVQVECLVGKRPKQAKVDRGYKAVKPILATQILLPFQASSSKSDYQKRKLMQVHRKRVGIEPVIGYLKMDYRLKRDSYKGVIENNINIMLVAVVFNFKRVMNQYKIFFWLFLQRLFFASANSFLIHSIN